MTTIWEAQPGPTPPLRDDDQGAQAEASLASHPTTPSNEPPYSDRGTVGNGYTYSPPTSPPPLPPNSSSPPTRRGSGRRAAVGAIAIAALFATGLGAGWYVTHDNASSPPVLQPARSNAQPSTQGQGNNAQANNAPGNNANNQQQSQSSNNQPSTPLVNGSSDEPAAAVAEALGPAVVQIELGQGLGSGVIYDRSGLILTNAHVVASSGGNGVTVRLQDGTALDGQVLGADTQADIAVVRVQPKGELPAARLATDKPKVGQTAIGIGSPFGLQETVTAGIISAVDRPVSGGDNGITINMLQTDAPINPGNSGGALANKKGEVIGINSQILSETGQNNGIGFAIPIQTAKSIADKIVNGESLDHGYLGVSSKAASDGQGGAQIASVASGSPAAKAGLQTGDVVTSVDGSPVKDAQDLSAAIVSHSAGDQVSLDVRHADGSTDTVTVQLGSRPTTQPSSRSPQQPQQQQPQQPR